MTVVKQVCLYETFHLLKLEKCTFHTSYFNSSIRKPGALFPPVSAAVRPATYIIKRTFSAISVQQGCNLVGGEDAKRPYFCCNACDTDELIERNRFEAAPPGRFVVTEPYDRAVSLSVALRVSAGKTLPCVSVLSLHTGAVCLQH